MRLYLLRHAEAEPHRIDDFSRHLTEKGKDQSSKVGNFLRNEGIQPDLLLSSPVLRARETAEIVGKKLKSGILETPWLACGMSPDLAIRELASYTRFEAIMLVGHEPDFSALAASLIGLPRNSSIQVGKASLACINILRPLPGAGILQFLLPVKFL